MNTWGYHSPMDYLKAAETSSSADELAFLAQSGYDFVKLAVSKNKHVTSAILLDLVPEDFSTWNQQELAGAISENLNVPEEALRKIAFGLRPFLNFGRDNQMAGQAAVSFCDNFRIPLEIIKLILEPKETSIRIRRKIANNCSRKDTLELLAVDPSDAVASRAKRALEKLQ